MAPKAIQTTPYDTEHTKSGLETSRSAGMISCAFECCQVAPHGGKDFATLWPLDSFGPMKRSAELRERADHYRHLKGRIDDRRALQALGELADEFEMTAAALERHCLIHKRAHEIWIERGCPEGRDVEHWLLAERELALEGQPTQRIRQYA